MELTEAQLPSPAGASGPRQSMSLPHNIHPDQMTADQSGNRWKRFQPLKKLQRMFRRKSKAKDEDGYPEAPKSFSASHLLPGQQRRRSRRDSPPMQSRLSMSHDSIFQSDGQQQGDMGSTLSIPGASSQLNAELRGVLLKRRGDDSDDDPGLPHSPATPPTVSTRLQKELKGQSGKSGGSCSDGSLLSMYSSGTCTDEDIFGPLSTHHSRVSLVRDPDTLELETSAALSHSAAKHRISVRPRRNHGAPRQHRRARPQTSPATTGLPPTVEEESPPLTPSNGDRSRQEASRVSSATGSSASPRLQLERPRRTPSASPSRNQSVRAVSPDGATSVPPRPTPVKRSKSSVADRRLRDLSPRKFWSRDQPPPVPASAGVLDAEDKKVEGFFSRIFGSRRSGRGKRKDGRSLSPETFSVDEMSSARPPAAPRSSHRQRMSRARSPPSALHADVIRPPPSSIPADVIRPLPSSASSDAAWTDDAVPSRVDGVDSPPCHRGPSDAALRRNGPAFLADVRAEVRALASGGDRDDDSTAAPSPQCLRRNQRASAMAAITTRGSESPRVKPRLVGLTSYQQRVTQMQNRNSGSPDKETKRRSFSCENISEESTRRNSSCSGMALGSVLSLIKATTSQENEAANNNHSRSGSPKDEEPKGDDPCAPGFGVALKTVRRDASSSPSAGPMSLDSSLLSGTAESTATPHKASSAESIQSGGSDRQSGGQHSPPEGRSARDPPQTASDNVPEFLKVHLQVVEGRQPASEPAPATRQQKTNSTPTIAAQPPASDVCKASVVKSSAAASTSVPLYSPSCEKRSAVAVKEVEVLRKETEDRKVVAAEASSSLSSSGASESPPQLRRPVPAPRSSSPDVVRRLSQVARSSKPVPEPASSDVVALRKKPPTTEDSELLKVFKRRSLRTRDPDDMPQNVAPTEGGQVEESSVEQPREETEETVASTSRQLPESRDGLDGSRHRASKSGSSGDASPAKLRRTELRRPVALSGSTTDSPAAPRPPSDGRSVVSEGRPLSDARSVTSEGRSVTSETARPASVTSSDSEPPRRVSASRRDSETRRVSAEEDSADPASWLKQTVKERRELREQRELKHLRPPQAVPAHQKELAAEAESAASTRLAAAPSTRSSRVLQMANTFQKLQTT